MDINTFLAEKKKKANEKQQAFQKNHKGLSGTSSQRQMPMRKTGRGK